MTMHVKEEIVAEEGNERHIDTLQVLHGLIRISQLIIPADSYLPSRIPLFLLTKKFLRSVKQEHQTSYAFCGIHELHLRIQGSIHSF